MKYMESDKGFRKSRNSDALCMFQTSPPEPLVVIMDGVGKLPWPCRLRMFGISLDTCWIVYTALVLTVLLMSVMIMLDELQSQRQGSVIWIIFTFQMRFFAFHFAFQNGCILSSVSLCIPVCIPEWTLLLVLFFLVFHCFCQQPVFLHSTFFSLQFGISEYWHSLQRMMIKIPRA